MNWKRLINWITYTVCFALMPLLFAWFFRALAGKETVETKNDFPEILFFSVMVCATTVGDLRSMEDRSRWNNSFYILESALLLGAIGSAVLYGGLRFAGIIDPAVSFRATLLTYSIYFTIIFSILSIVSQVLIVFVEHKDE